MLVCQPLTLLSTLEGRSWFSNWRGSTLRLNARYHLSSWRIYASLGGRDLGGWAARYSGLCLSVGSSFSEGTPDWGSTARACERGSGCASAGSSSAVAVLAAGASVLAFGALLSSVRTTAAATPAPASTSTTASPVTILRRGMPPQYRERRRRARSLPEGYLRADAVSPSAGVRTGRRAAGGRAVGVGAGRAAAAHARGDRAERRYRAGLAQRRRLLRRRRPRQPSRDRPPLAGGSTPGGLSVHRHVEPSHPARCGRRDDRDGRRRVAHDRLLSDAP